MDSKIVDIKTNTSTNNLHSILANVVKVEQGEATRIHLSAINKEADVFAHSSSVPALRVGDRILVNYIDESGYIVTHRLRGEGEKPQQGFDVMADGSLQINHDKSIVMRVNGAKIEIRPDGRVLIAGKEIYSTAKGKHRLQGTTLELN